MSTAMADRVGDKATDQSLDGLVALVTGGASGIGLATSLMLRSAGAQVASLDIATADASGILNLRADVTSQGEVNDAVAKTLSEFGKLDMLINNSGIGTIGSIADTTDDEWIRVFDVNVVGIVRTTRAALPHLRQSKVASITNVSSIVATVGVPQRACYSASKGAVLSLTLATAADLLGDRIRVNCVCPGTVDTPWVTRLLDQSPDPASERAALEARQPMGRLATPEEIARAIAFLASPSSSFLTGTVLTVDGGLSGIRVA